MTGWRRGWPWLVGLGFLLGYEIVAALTHHRTLSEMVWTASAAWPPLPYLVIAFTVVLYMHFWGGWWAPERKDRP